LKSKNINIVGQIVKNSFLLRTLYKYCLTITILLIISPVLNGQISKTTFDSLVNLTKSPIDSVRLESLKKLTWECRFSDPLQGFEYGFDGIALAEKLNNYNDLAILYNYIGVIATKIKSLDKAKIQIKLARQIADSLNITTEKAYALNNLGEIYNLTGNLDSAFVCLTEAAELFISIDNLKGLAYTYNQMGLAMRSQNKLEEAIKYHIKVLEIREKLQDKAYITRAIQNLGIDLLEKKNFAEARKYLEKIDPNQLEIRAYFSIPYRLILLGMTYDGENNKSTAIKYYKKAFQIAYSTNLYNEMRDAAKLLSDIYSNKKDYKTALMYFNTYKAMDDSVKSSNLVADFKQLEMKIAFDQRFKYLEYKMQQDIDKQKLKLQRNKILIYCFIVFFVILFVFIIIQIKNYKTIASKNALLIAQKNDIENKNEAILKQHDELEIANATKDTFFSIIAHDLRGPIGNFYSFTNMIIESYQTEISDKIMNFLLVVNSSAQQTLSLLENLLTWASSQQGAIAFFPVMNNLYNIIENNINLMQSKAHDKKVTIQNLLPPNLVCEIDNYMIDTVIRNLLGNAIKFSYPNSTITFSGKITKEYVEVTVNDSGVGMTKEVVDQLFRIDVKHKSKDGTNGEKGTGLGLILCKEFIEKHGGKIWVKSEIGKGSAFLFTIPLNNKVI